MGLFCLVGALVQVPFEGCAFEGRQPEQTGGNLDVHSPTDKFPDDAGQLLGAYHFCDFVFAEDGPVFAASATSRQEETSAGGFEIEVFVFVCRVLQEYLHAGIFPTMVQVLHDLGPETV